SAGGSSQRPLAGPVVPLTVAAGGGDELLGAARPTRPLTADAVAVRVLMRGEAIPALGGRADDFRWPRGAGIPEAPPDPPAVASAPASTAQASSQRSAAARAEAQRAAAAAQQQATAAQPSQQAAPQRRALPRTTPTAELPPRQQQRPPAQI